MPSNKNRDLKKQMDRTGKSEIIHYTVSISPSIQADGSTLYKILRIGFTVFNDRATIISTEVVGETSSEAGAFNKFQVEVVRTGSLDLKHLRQLVKELREEFNAKKANP